MSDSVYDVSIHGLDGAPLDLHAYSDDAVLVVNVASRCGLTPQYTGLEERVMIPGGSVADDKTPPTIRAA